MTEVDIEIGGRTFTVACQEGEESHLHSAAQLLDVEATHLMNAAGRLPEPKMLLMAGLMLADKNIGMQQSQTADATAGSAENAELDDALDDAKARIAALEAQLSAQSSEHARDMAGMVEQVERLAQELTA